MVLVSLMLAIMLLLFFEGGKENIIQERQKSVNLDELMPPNELVYKYLLEYSDKYEIPRKFVMKCAKIESGYRGFKHKTYAPFADRLVSSAYAYSVLQVRVIAAREVWPQFNYEGQLLLPYEYLSDRWLKEQKAREKYRKKHNLKPSIKLTYKSDDELAYMLRYDLKFSIESGIKYMRFLRNAGFNWVQVYSIYNQGWHGKNNINSYARFVVYSG